MFRSTRPAEGPTVTLTVEGTSLTVSRGITVAAALLEAGIVPTRTTPVGAVPRAPYCMMGVCFECLVEIDGIPNRQACMIDVEDGMRVHRQHGAARIVSA